MTSDLRWTLAGDKPTGLFETCRQVVGKGRYRGLTFLEVESKTIINRVAKTRYFPFEYTINCYRGCSHACVYCFARPSHDYLGLGIGEDFDRKIVVKVNAVEMTRAQTAPRHWAGHSIAMGTNTDPYQPAEGKYRLTRGVVEVLAERANPFSLLTKSPLVLRDRHLLAEAARRAEVTVSFSVGTLDTDVWKRSEPGTPHPRQRLEAVRKLKGLGIPSGVLVAPLLPGISDAPRQVAEVMRACRDAGADFAAPIRLHLRPGVKEHYMEWLAEEFPDLVGTYHQLYGNRSYLPRPSPSGRRKSNPARQSPKPRTPASPKNGQGRLL
ncbi:MAG: radical SAM protein [bacterium]|nr:radical SAM protein [Acidimicrobiia bacterium]MCY4650267.1 radical SAM protein [bacterium]